MSDLKLRGNSYLFPQIIEYGSLNPVLITDTASIEYGIKAYGPAFIFHILPLKDPIPFEPTDPIYRSVSVVHWRTEDSFEAGANYLLDRLMYTVQIENFTLIRVGDQNENSACTRICFNGRPLRSE